MPGDMTVPCGDGLINIRVGAIIMKNGKLLMAGNRRVDYLYAVGGRVQFGETAEEAVVREVEEETGVRLKTKRLGFVHENLFYDDDPASLDMPIYEIAFFYYMDTPEDFEPASKVFDENGVEEFLVWVPLDDERTTYPGFLRPELKHPERTVKHFVTDHRRQRNHECPEDRF